MKQFLKKTSLIIILLFFLFNVKVPTVKSFFEMEMMNIDELAKLIWEVFDEFMDEKVDEITAGMGTIPDGDDAIGFIESFMTEIVDAELFGIDSETGLPFDASLLFGDVDGADGAGGAGEFTSIFEGISLTTRDGSETTMYSAINDIMSRLRNSGFFQMLHTQTGMTEAEFRSLLTTIYFRDIMEPIIDAETQELVGVGDEIEITITPPYPRPGDSVDIAIQSFSFDINSSQITWWANGVVMLSGVGAHSLKNYLLDKSGLPEDIFIVIQKTDGGIIEKTIQIHPADVDMIFESYTHTPPFYKGKPEYSHSSLVKLIALPNVRDKNGNLINKNNFRYRWYVNNKIISDSERVGKNYFYYEDSMFHRDTQISLSIDSINSDFNTQKRITLSPVDPEIVLYEEDPIYGTIFNRAIGGTISTPKREVTIRAVPYFFSDNNRISFSWSVGRRRLSEFVDSIITFRAESDDIIETNLGVSIKNLDKVGQSAYTYFKLLVNN